jgi:hypothetical protein
MKKRMEEHLPSTRTARTAIGARAIGAQAIKAQGIGGLAIGALAVGAVAIGTLALGRLLIGRLAIRRTRLGVVEIDELRVGRLHILDKMDHAISAPTDIPPPESLPDWRERLAPFRDKIGPWYDTARPIDVRYVPPDPLVEPELRTNRQLVWMRADGSLPDDPVLHACIVTYASDMTLIDTTLKLIRAERGYVFLRDEDGQLRLAAGRNAKGEAERSAIAHALEETRWNRKAAARLLSISYRALLYKIQEYRLVPPPNTHRLYH